MKTKLIEAYLDWTNNYILTSKFGAAYGLTDEQARIVIALGRELHEARVAPVQPKEFTVVAVSSNTNSFGLKSILLLAPDGEGWEILKSPYNDGPLRKGDVVTRTGDCFDCGTYECPRRLRDTSPKSAVKIIKEAKP